jgi:3-(methylthio)propionyl---CoA ligase
VAPLIGLMQETPLLISSFLRYAEEFHPDRLIVSRDYRGCEYIATYRLTAARARRLAKALITAGILAGDRVATLAMNHHRHFELFYGVSGTGAVLHTVNPRLFDDQIAYICNHAESRILFFDPPFAAQVGRLVARLPHLERCILLSDANELETVRATLPPTLPLIDYETFIAAQDDLYTWAAFDERTASSLCYTSGTTGNPKGVLYSHRSTVLHAFAACQNCAMGLCAHDVIMPLAPMYHANAWSMPYLAPMLGANLVLPGPKLDGASLQQLIERHGVTFTVAVPTVFSTLLDYLESSGKRIDTLKKATIGGTAVPGTMVDVLREKYGCFVAQVWGMTELSPLGTMTTITPAVAALTPAEAKRFLYKQGRAQFGLELKLLDTSGKPVPRDGSTAGSLWVRGPWAARAYFKDAEDLLDDEGYFHTGDVGTLDAHGYLTITDRIKDVIKSGGEWISSVQLENVAYTHPAVRLAAVIGVKHPKWDERPVLVVETQNGANPTKDDILNHMKPHIAKWWLPDDVVFVENMPMTATGKVRKIALREFLADYHSRSSSDGDSVPVS